MHINIKPRKNIHVWTLSSSAVKDYKNWHPGHSQENDFRSQNKNFRKTESIRKETPADNSWQSSFSGIFKKYCSTSTLHGLQYVGSNEYNIYERIFWILSFLTASAFSIYFITSIYERYDVSPVIVSFKPQTISVDKIPFPSVTVCNVNLVIRSEAERIISSGSEVEKRLLEDVCDIKPTFSNYSVNVDDATDDWETVRNFILTVNQKCSDMFKVCKWENKRISCDDYINSVLTDEGYCCSFNRLPANYTFRKVLPGDLNETYPGNIIDWNEEDGYPPSTAHDRNLLPIKAFGSGASLGLTLVMDADLDQYYCTSTSSIGFKIRLSNPIDNPKMADFGFLLTPGIEARIPIDPVISEATPGLRSIDIQKRQCYFSQEKRLIFYRVYTEKNCKLECQALFTLSKCGCVPYFLPKNASMKICDQRTEKCSLEAKSVIEDISSTQRKACKCLPGCFSIHYERKIVSRGRLSSKTNLVHRDLLQGNSLSHFADSAIIAHIYFESDKYRIEMKSELYGFSEFLSNTGGLLGLFIGVSFLSIVEIFYFLFYKTAFMIYSKRETKKGSSGVNDLPYIN